MPFFKVTLCGEGIAYQFSDGSKAIGFFTTRLVRASNREGAGEVAKQLILHEWVNGVLARNNTGLAPALRVEDTQAVNFFKAIVGRKPTGYSFYSKDN
jgi:hypothetical protein